MASEDAPAAKRLTREGSFSGVWWKLGDAAVDPSVAERRLRSIGDEEADLRARLASRQATGRGVRRTVAVASLALEALAFAHAYWTARRRRTAGWSRKLLLLMLSPLLAVPASAAVVLAAFARFQKLLERRDEGRLRALVAERKAKIGQFRGSHHNIHKLVQKYDPDAETSTTTSELHHQPAPASMGMGKRRGSHQSMRRLLLQKRDPDAAAAETGTAGSSDHQSPVAGVANWPLKRSHSRLRFHIDGDDDE